MLSLYMLGSFSILSKADKAQTMYAKAVATVRHSTYKSIHINEMNATQLLIIKLAYTFSASSQS